MLSSTTTNTNSLNNLSTYLSRHRPWSTLITSLTPPNSLSSSFTRLQANTKHFFINYILIIFASASFFLLFSNPFAMIVYALVLISWLLGWFFREGEVVFYGRHVDDNMVVLVLAVGTMLVLWLVGMLTTLFMGISFGVLIVSAHGVFRDTDGLFLDEDDAVSNGLIASSSRSKGFSSV